MGRLLRMAASLADLNPQTHTQTTHTHTHTHTHARMHAHTIATAITAKTVMPSALRC